MKILVTGGAGFIGSHLCEKFLNEKENEVICIDNFNNFYDPAIKWRNVSKLRNNANYKLIEKDILDMEFLESLFKNNEIELIFHLAARAGVRPSINEPHLYNSVNIDGTLNLLECMKKYGVKNMVFASSSSVYGNNKNVPFSEEKTKPLPISPYGATKVAGELLCYVYCELFGLNISCLRYFTVYGPKQRPEMAIYKFISNIFFEKKITIYGEGGSKRDYTYVDDIVEGTILAGEKLNGFNIYNLGSSNPISLNELVEEIANCLNKKPIIERVNEQLGDMKVTYADITKAKAQLGYTPKVKLKEGIKRMCEWFIDEKS